VEGLVSLADSVVSSRKIPEGQSGELLSLPRDIARWEWMSFFVRRLAPGGKYQVATQSEEAVFVILGGKCVLNWVGGEQMIGGRASVFDGFPYAFYLPPNGAAVFTGETTCEIAECRVPSVSRLEPKIIAPKDTIVSLRGGGNASRQIVDVITPDFPADKLIVVEVYTPGGNWSSYPPHKHEVHDPPVEVDLDEIYYYRMNKPGAFALQHLYPSNYQQGMTIRVVDGDAVLVRDGYHPVVAGPGYDVYYLNFLAGSARAMNVTEDERHTWIRSTWNTMDPRLPLIRG
jgi:5-deoxy-glucuronate isomerase